MKDRAVVLLSIALLTSTAWAQSRPASSAPAASGDGMVGTITGTNVYVRSSPSGTAYPCTKLSSPATVTIVKTGAWLEILPPAGTFSVIKKDFVAKDGDSGTVNADAVWTRPGGDLRTKDFWEIQIKLNKGDKVKVLGELGEYYKIEPPPGAHFYISADYVTTDGKKPVSGNTVIGGATTRTSDNAGLASRSGNGSADGIVRVVREPTTRTATTVSVSYAKELESLDALEKELAAEWAKPIEQRDVKGLLDKYKALEIADSDIKSVQDGRVKFLQSILDRKSASIAAEKIIEDALKRKAEDDRKLAAIKIGVTKDFVEPTHYDAEGVLYASNLFTGNASGPKRYVLRDPVVTKNVTAYVQCTSNAVVLEDYLGKHIGVMGKPQYDKTMMLNVIEVEKVIQLPSSAQIPASPKPEIKDSTGTGAAPASPATLPAAPPTIEVKDAPAAPAAPATSPAAPTAGATPVVSAEIKSAPTAASAPVTIQAGAPAGIIKVTPVGPDKSTGSPEEMDLSETEAANRYVAEHSTTAPAATTKPKPVIEESR